MIVDSLVLPCLLGVIDVPHAVLFRTLAIVNLGVFLITMTLPLWTGRKSGYRSP